MMYKDDSERTSSEQSSKVDKKDQLKKIYWNSYLEIQVHNVVLEKVYQKYASGFEFKKKISIRKMTQLFECEKSGQFQNVG